MYCNTIDLLTCLADTVESMSADLLVGEPEQVSANTDAEEEWKQFPAKRCFKNIALVLY